MTHEAAREFTRNLLRLGVSAWPARNSDGTWRVEVVA